VSSILTRASILLKDLGQHQKSIIRVM
jgi:hypothetical protein